jgi:hypothetical protein
MKNIEQLTGSQEVVGSNPIFSTANTTPESYGVAVLSDLNTLLANYGMAVDAALQAVA